ncbi:uncharacterized protein BDR25DRAFT_359531 [Lindgomyces ingoldianus]|uniref:Uncharacterized protein n=1 Tax=Lindgomyces ingoldianus TaxID=673940 RepID=A0ACB6QJZ0_9PLEO|nr:uncharacterized protein BDR25DRAFT_359531 [Lindgomyces ingoldianus]KAF2466632.1 hypothetical protein BDR25DRAFT_359531 [Lindgomyces ingoldianus]
MSSKDHSKPPNTTPDCEEHSNTNPPPPPSQPESNSTPGAQDIPINQTTIHVSDTSFTQDKDNLGGAPDPNYEDDLDAWYDGLEEPPTGGIHDGLLFLKIG